MTQAFPFSFAGGHGLRRPDQRPGGGLLLSHAARRFPHLHEPTSLPAAHDGTAGQHAEDQSQDRKPGRLGSASAARVQAGQFSEVVAFPPAPPRSQLAGTLAALPIPRNRACACGRLPNPLLRVPSSKRHLVPQARPPNLPQGAAG